MNDPARLGITRHQRGLPDAQTRHVPLIDCRGDADPCRIAEQEQNPQRGGEIAGLDIALENYPVDTGAYDMLREPGEGALLGGTRGVGLGNGAIARSARCPALGKEGAGTMLIEDRALPFGRRLREQAPLFAIVEDNEGLAPPDAIRLVHQNLHDRSRQPRRDRHWLLRLDIARRINELDRKASAGSDDIHIARLRTPQQISGDGRHKKQRRGVPEACRLHRQAL